MMKRLWPAALVLVGTGCSLDGLLNSDKLPPEVSDPAIAQTPTGAREAYYGVLSQFRQTFGGISGNQSSFVALTGLLSDELHENSEGAVDRRVLPEGTSTNDLYPALQKTRAQAGQAIELATRYLPEAPELRSHLFALEGFTELFLAEFFCSGIPLSTVDYSGNFTYRAGSSTEQVFAHAVALFDTALTLTGDSAQFRDLAQIGRGRALLALGQYAAAAAAVAPVADGFHYDVLYNNVNSGTGAAQNFGRIMQTGNRIWDLTIPDQEGINGLDWRTSGDPRIPVRARSYADNGVTKTNYSFNAYAVNGASPIVLASGVEARLIQAEAALQVGDVSTWLTTLNQLRTTGETTVPADTIIDTLGVSGCGGGASLCGHSPGGDDPVEFGQPAGGFPVPAGYSLVSVDTTYPAPSGVGNPGGLCDQRSWYRPCYQGDSMVVYVYVNPTHTTAGVGTGGVAGLDVLTDPGTPAGRVDLLFRERAFWLFLTGHRQGDLRRLVRTVDRGGYGRSQSTVYPVGPYSGTSFSYGSDITAPIPRDEYINPLYTGCASRGA